MTFIRTYLTAFLFTWLSTSLDAQVNDSVPKQVSYEDFGLYTGISMVKLSDVDPGATLNFGFTSGGKRFKYGFGYGISVKRGDSGTQYLTAYGLTNSNKLEVAHDSKAGYSFVSLDFQYYLKSTENRIGSNFYGNVAFVTQIFSMVVTNGKYDAAEYYVQDEIFNPANVKVNRAMGYAARLAVGYQYTFSRHFAVTSHIGYDLNFGENRKFSLLVLPDTHALMIGLSARYIMIFSGRH